MSYMAGFGWALFAVGMLIYLAVVGYALYLATRFVNAVEKIASKDD